MSEFARVYRKRNILFVIILVILNTGLFILSCSSEKEITLTGDMLQSYIEGYEEYNENIKKNSETMQQLNIYKKGFASDNIRKTAKLYSRTDTINVRAGENRGIVLFVQYHLTDLFLLAFMVIIAADMISERKKGLVRAVRSTVRGRGRLYLYRVMILGVSALVMTLLLYGGNYLSVLVKYGRADLSRSIQSVPEFMQCPYSMSAGLYIIRMLFLKVEVSFAVSLIFYLFLSLWGTGIAYTVSGTVAAVEIMMCRLVPAVSSVNHLRYINLCTALKSELCYTEIFFLNIFGKAVPLLSVLHIFLFLTVTAAAVTGYVVHSRGYVTEVSHFQKITDNVGRIKEKIFFQRTLSGWEAYKLLVKQGGLFYVTGVFVLVLMASSKYNYLYQTNYLETEWYEKYHGVITEEKMAQAVSDAEKIQNQIDFFIARLENLYTREMAETVAFQITQTQENLNKAQLRLEALNTVAENMKGGYDYYQRTGNKVDLIKPYSYDLLIVRDTASKNRASLYILIGIVGAVSGVFAYDTQSNMRNTLRAAFRGRTDIITAKLVPVCVICAVLCTAVHMIQFVQIGKFMEYNDMGSPVQSLPFMRDFRLYISIRYYFVLMFAVRAAFSCVVGLICCVISRFCQDTSTALGISIFVLAVPSLLAQIIPGADFINAVYLIGGGSF